MTYESLLKLLQKSFIQWTGKDGFTNKITTDTRDFRTLTVWFSKDGYKISVRWAGGADCSSIYCSSLESAYNNFLVNFQNDYGKNQWKFLCR